MYRESAVGWVPREWEVRELDSAIRIVDCKHYTPKFVDNGFPFVRPRNVKLDGLDLSDIEFVTEPDYRLLTHKHEPRRGDIVFSRNASFGIPCFVDTDRKFAIGQDVVVMSETEAVSRFIYYALKSEVTIQQIESVSTGSTFGRINLAFIRKLRVPLPTPDEQLRIVTCLDSFEQQMESERQYVDMLRQAKAGLMQDLLTGRVRVKVDATDAFGSG